MTIWQRSSRPGRGRARAVRRTQAAREGAWWSPPSTGRPTTGRTGRRTRRAGRGRWAAAAVGSGGGGYAARSASRVGRSGSRRLPSSSGKARSSAARSRFMAVARSRTRSARSRVSSRSAASRPSGGAPEWFTRPGARTRPHYRRCLPRDTATFRRRVPAPSAARSARVGQPVGQPGPASLPRTGVACVCCVARTRGLRHSLSGGAVHLLSGGPTVRVRPGAPPPR